MVLQIYLMLTCILFSIREHNADARVYVRFVCYLRYPNCCVSLLFVWTGNFNISHTSHIIRSAVGFLMSFTFIILIEFQILQGFQSGNIYSKSAMELFKSCCLILAGYMTLSQTLRFINNKDLSSISYKDFNETPGDPYPTFSICLSSRILHSYDYSLQHLFSNDLLAKFGFDSNEYNKLLKGEDIVRKVWGTTLEFENISQIDHDQFVFKLESILTTFEFKAQDSTQTTSRETYKKENKSWPFYVGYADPDIICFTRKSEMESDLIRDKDLFRLYLNVLNESMVVFEIFIHQSGQLIRSLTKSIYRTTPSTDIYLTNNAVTVELTSVTVLKKRANANIPCNATLVDDDTKFRLEIISWVGCVPMYWKNIMAVDESFKVCTTSTEMADIFYAIENYKEIMASYVQPCEYMKVIVVNSEKAGASDERLLINLKYVDESYQEITNSRDFGFKDYGSGVGGWVGIFLGYALLNVPESLVKLWVLFSTKIQYIWR